MTKRETFDYIVVGAGSAGCVLANRLSEWANVLLLEAGPRDDYFWIHVPGGNAKTMRNPDVNWMFETAPDSGINGRSDYWPRGKVLGGSSSINGTIYVRGQPADYDHWARLGNEGWRWQDVLPYFLRAEGNDRGASDLHGATGPLPVTTIAERHPLIEAFIGAASELGVPRNDDFNGRAQRGAGYYQLNVRNAKRWSAAVAYLRPVAGRARLRVQTGAHATRVLMDGDRAIGIEYRHDGALHQAYAHAEVLLTAGALQSPQLLMLSGIGPAQHLRDHNLEVTLDLPGVGENLQDHLQARPAYRCTRPITVNDAAGSFFGRAKLFANWALFRRGLLASGLNQGGAFVNVLTDSAQPDMQIHLALFSSEKAGAALHPYPGFTISVCHLRPESRGRLRLASSDPLVAPHIAPGYLQSRHDVATMVASVRFARKLTETHALAPFVASEIRPGKLAQSDADIEQFVRNTASTTYHPVGTCKMGTDPLAVVDDQLRVYGLRNLRVVDGSIMPTIVSGNTHAPIVMIAEKAADMIRAVA